jgi:hypothetical protein
MSKLAKKEALKQECESYVPVFKIKPLSLNDALCKYIGNINNADKLGDDLIEITDKSDKKVSILKLSDVKSYSVFAKTCSCNVIADYFVKKDKSGKLIISNKKIPVYYMTILYANQLVSGFLVTLFVYFNLNDDSFDEKPKKYNKKIQMSDSKNNRDDDGNIMIDNPKKIINKRLTGKYTYELVTDEGFLGYLIEKMRPILEERFMTKYVDEFDGSEEEVFKKINDEVENVINIYRDMFEKKEFDKLPTVTRIVDMMKKTIYHENFNDIINIALNFREEERRRNMCPDQNYESPKKVINLQEFKDNPEKIDEYINNLSDSDTDYSTDEND